MQPDADSVRPWKPAPASRRAWTRRSASMRVIFACALLFPAVLLAAPASAHFSPRKAIWGPSTQGTTSLWPTFRQLGVGIYEDSMYWNAVAPRRPRHPRDPNDPAYIWPAQVTQDVAQAARYHIRVSMMLVFSPAWANGGRTPQWAPLHPSDYADFAMAAARRYPTVHLWMIWGEPSRVANFEPEATVRPGKKLTAKEAGAPHIYARILDAAYQSLKSVSGKNLIIGGMTFAAGAIDTQQWVENMVLPNGKRPRLDMYGHNPFSYRQPNLANRRSPYGQVDFSDLGRLSSSVDKHLGHGRHVPLFLSEWTIPTQPDFEFPFWVNEPTQAQWINAGFSILRHWSRIYALGWIHLYDVPGVTFGGLIRADGTLKPGFFAFKNG
jgi:hypothetical protein